MPRINIAEFRKQILEEVGKKMSNEAFSVAREKFAIMREKLQKDFKEHLVTQEILDGPTPETSKSGAISGRGNLYSFIGFNFDEDQGKNHIEAIQQILEESVTIRPTKTFKIGGKNVVWSFGVFLPSEEQLIEVTPMPWDSASSWLVGVERRGISNLNHYIFRAFLAGSRSSTGLQVKGTYRKGEGSGTFRTVPYVFALLKQFRGLFNKV